MTLMAGRVQPKSTALQGEIIRLGAQHRSAHADLRQGSAGLMEQIPGQNLTPDQIAP